MKLNDEDIYMLLQLRHLLDAPGFGRFILKDKRLEHYIPLITEIEKVLVENSIDIKEWL